MNALSGARGHVRFLGGGQVTKISGGISRGFEQKSVSVDPELVDRQRRFYPTLNDFAP